MLKRSLLLVFVLSVGLSMLTGCATAPAAPRERTIYMAAIEPKGTTNVSKEAFPADVLPEGGGYILKEPDAEGNWVIEAYRFTPGTVVVQQGDIVTLEILGINGAEHPFTIEGYDVSGVVTRGAITRVTFTADKPGIFRVICGKHLPGMTADLVVLAN